MAQAELVERLRRLPLADRFAFLEAALQSVQEDVERLRGKDLHDLNRAERDLLLAAGAAVMLEDYLTDDGLTAFTALDGEDFLEEE